jgi:hypothetical protein
MNVCNNSASFLSLIRIIVIGKAANARKIEQTDQAWIVRPRERSAACAYCQKSKATIEE